MGWRAFGCGDLIESFHDINICCRPSFISKLYICAGVFRLGAVKASSAKAVVIKNVIRQSARWGLL